MSGRDAVELQHLRKRIQQLENRRPAAVQSDAAAEDKNDRLADFAASMGGWFWETDADQRFTYISPNIFDITGVTPEWHYGKTRAEMGSPASVTAIEWEKHLELTNSHLPFSDFIFERLSPNGAKWLRTSGRPIFDGQGEFKGYRGTATDITAEVTAEKRADRLTSAIEDFDEIFVLWDPDDRLVLCNRKFREINARVAETTEPGTHFDDHIRIALAAGLYPNAAGREEEWVAERKARHLDPGEPFEMERQDGRWILLSEQKLADGSVATVSTDITKRKLAEKALRESEERLRVIFDNVPIAFFLKDTEGRYKFINSRFADWFGVDPSTIENKSVHNMFPKERADRYHVGDQQVIETLSVVSDVVEIPLSSGETRTFTLTKFPVINDGILTDIGGVMIDVTELKQTEKALLLAKNQAEEANRSKSAFLASMSHELRTPLNAIIGFSEIMSKGLLAQQPERYREYAGDIHASGKHLNNLVADLLDMSSIEAGRLRLQFEAVELAPVVDGILRMLRQRVEIDGVEITVDIPGDLPPLAADRRSLHQVISNLVTNSIKHTPAGGEIVIAASNDDTRIKLTVSDTGHGIEPEDLAHVFDPYYVVDVATRNDGKSHGLGLAITERLVKALQGSIHLESTVGQGTTVEISLPQYGQAGSNPQSAAQTGD